ncbi:tumor necrosis factor receptor superfamily member 19L isoform X2 [Pelobates cultripes]|uniref:Tumor necrosis factor receptor superfamily member 19L isoform X2 n=1 Tax=Pelobates cultripes TaxID=61616 RepID=A0AAD1R7V4_PELCU|nr:tumor necrosis factor receptor superfamily member 19L isoform X2 [Pelobates cultripes]
MKGMERFILTASLLTLLLWRGGCQSDCGKWQYTDEGGHCVPCLECPLGEEPDGVCGFGTGAGVTCQKCGPGMFSSHSGISFCNPHTLCEKRKRVQLKAGTPTSDAQCGDCLPGFFSPVGKSKSISTCFQCALAPPDTVGCEGLRTLRPRPPRTIDPSSTSNIKMPLNNTQKGVKEDSGINPACMLEENGNEDTIGVLVRLITEKKENAVALEELLKEYQSKPISPVNKASQKLHLLPQMPHMCKHQNHMHTIQGQASRSGLCCSRCSQKKWTDVLLSPDLAPVSNVTKASRTVCKPGRTGEITILSVGRFRVARIPEQKVPPPEVKTISDQNVPLEDGSEQRGLLCNTVRAKNRSLEDTSKLEDVI